MVMAYGQVCVSAKDDVCAGFYVIQKDARAKEEIIYGTIVDNRVLVEKINGRERLHQQTTPSD